MFNDTCYVAFIVDWLVLKLNVCCVCKQDVNHAVVAVGYGEENGVPYWLIKNSWGADWGLNGYFKMEMGKNMCGMSSVFNLFNYVTSLSDLRRSLYI